MFKLATLGAEMRRCLRFAVPLIGAQLVHTGHGLADMLVAGQLGRAEMAAAGVAAMLWFVSSLLCLGLLASLSPLFSERIGQRRYAAVGDLFRQGLWLGVLIGGFATCLLMLFAASLPIWGLQQELIPLIRQHAFTACWSLLPVAIVMTCRNLCEATQRTKPIFIVTLLGLVVNVLGNLGLGLGWFGLPKLGLQGIGISTTLVSISMMLSLLYLLKGKTYKRYQLYSQFQAPRRQDFMLILGLSVPIFFALVFESGLFAATMIQMGMLGTLQTAAHSLAMSVTSFSYMFPLGLSFALTARVGQVFGRGAGTGNGASLQLRVQSGIFLTFMFAAATSLALVIFRHPVAALYTDDQAVRELAAALILLAAIFQFSDGAQATLLGMLRGLQDVRVPVLINACSYWLAFCIGAWLAHKTTLGAYGLWIGLICGLTLSALTLGLRLWFVTKKFATAPDAHILPQTV